MIFIIQFLINKEDLQDLTPYNNLIATEKWFTDILNHTTSFDKDKYTNAYPERHQVYLRIHKNIQEIERKRLLQSN